MSSLGLIPVNGHSSELTRNMSLCGIVTDLRGAQTVGVERPTRKTVPPSATKLSQSDAQLARQLALLLTLSTTGTKEKPLTSEWLALGIADYITPPKTQTAAEAWINPDLAVRGVVRSRAREKLQDDVLALRQLGFGIEFNETKIVVDRKKVFARTYYLERRPLVPLTLPAKHRPDVVRFVAAERAAIVEFTAAARLFATGINETRHVVVRREGRAIDLAPVALVLSEYGRWLGIGRLLGTGETRTFRIGDRWEVELTDTVVPPGKRVDIARAVHPLTWGPVVVVSSRIEVLPRAIEQTCRLLGPSIASHPSVVPTPQGSSQGHAVGMDLESTNQELLMTRLASLRTSVHLPDPHLRAQLRQHLSSLLAPVLWPQATPMQRPLPTPTRPIAPAQQATQGQGTRSDLPAVSLAPLKGKTAGSARVSALVFALSLLDQQPQWLAVDQAARLGLTVARLATLLMVYLAAESDVANTMDAHSAGFSPLVLTTRKGVLVEVTAHAPAKEGTRGLGRYQVEQDLLLTACVAALGQLHAEPQGLRAVGLRAFVDAVSEALGLNVLQRPTAEDEEVLSLLGAAVRRNGGSIDPELVLSRGDGVKPARRSSASAVLTFMYIHPWTADQTVRGVVPLGLRLERGQAVLDAIDLEVDLDVAATPRLTERIVGPSPERHVRTFALGQMSKVRKSKGSAGLDSLDVAMFQRYAERDLVVSLAVNPGATATIAALERGCGAQIDSDGSTCTALVRMRAPVAERLFYLLVEFPLDVRIIQPGDLDQAVRATAIRILQHHTP